MYFIYNQFYYILTEYYVVYLKGVEIVQLRYAETNCQKFQVENATRRFV